MPHVKLALVGFGNVGRNLADLLIQKRLDLSDFHNITFTVTGIATSHHGTLLDDNGIVLEDVLALVEENQPSGDYDISTLSSQPSPASTINFIKASKADLIFENTPVNYKDGQPAVEHIRAALESQMHVITANKGPVVHAYYELYNIARQAGKHFFFESSVMDGAPIFSLFREALPLARLLSFQGILNSTSNYVLTKMEEGFTQEKAIKFAQEIGIAESDPTGDIDGWDAVIKTSALITVIMGIPIHPSEVEREGIRDITLEKVEEGLKEDKRWKLICRGELNENGEVSASVMPVLVDSTSPCFNVSGASSMVQFNTDVLGDLTIIENDPGPHTTAYGLLADFINIYR